MPPLISIAGVHHAVKPRHLIGIDQPHHAFFQALRGDEGVTAAGDDVNDRAAQAGDVIKRLHHQTVLDCLSSSGLVFGS